MPTTGSASLRRDAAPAPRPTFAARTRYVRAMEALFELLVLPDETVRVLSAAPLLRDGTLLLSGTYGTGKTSYASALGRVLFARSGEDPSPDLGQISAHQELLPSEALYSLDLPALLRGREKVFPRAFVAARLKFLNEVQRASHPLLNAVLGLLSERRLVYRDEVLASPAFFCVLDRNPVDHGSIELPGAFLDRIDLSVNMPLPNVVQGYRAQVGLIAKGRVPGDRLEDLLRPHFCTAEMEKVWSDVAQVSIPSGAVFTLQLIAEAFRACKLGDRGAMQPLYELPCENCEFKAGLCSRLETVPGLRFTNSVLRLGQALAWLDGRDSVGLEDLRFALPYGLAHRLALRAEVLATYPSAEDWMRDYAWCEYLAEKLELWQEVVRSRSLHVLREKAKFDLVLQSLAGSGEPDAGRGPRYRSKDATWWAKAAE